MSSWVLSSNPTTIYRAKDWIEDGNTEMDWISRNNFAIGDTMYIYEVLPKNGRGGIVYKTIVVDTGLTLENKIDDEEYRIGESYPDYITSETTFNRLGNIMAPHNEIVPYRELKERGFTAPQIGAYLLDGKQDLLKYIRSHFD